MKNDVSIIRDCKHCNGQVLVKFDTNTVNTLGYVAHCSSCKTWYDTNLTEKELDEIDKEIKQARNN